MTPEQDMENNAAITHCPVCGAETTFVHDHKPDESGLDDGICFLPGQAPRKRAAPKPPEVMREIRSRAWATRRMLYGQRGHR
tara:strand:+ start:15206 stop:15451 length:246 start_codon:yes stop_codon:yes gene_type:complete